MGVTEPRSLGDLRNRTSVASSMASCRLRSAPAKCGRTPEVTAKESRAGDVEELVAWCGDLVETGLAGIDVEFHVFLSYGVRGHESEPADRAAGRAQAAASRRSYAEDVAASRHQLSAEQRENGEHVPVVVLTVGG